MTSSEIFKLESSNTNEIHLLRSGMFFHAWNKSAYFFSKHFKSFEVHCKFVKKIGAEMLYLGFPDTSFSQIREMAIQKGFAFETVDENHFVIKHFVVFTDYDAWKRQKFKESLAKSQAENGNKNTTESAATENAAKVIASSANGLKMGACGSRQLLYAYKEFYESTKYIVGRTSEIARSMRVSLVERLRNECFDLLDHLDFCQMGLDSLNDRFANRKLCQIRQKLRLLMDLRQITPKQWYYITDKIYNIRKTLRLQSSDSRIEGECQPESSNPLPAEALPILVQGI